MHRGQRKNRLISLPLLALLVAFLGGCAQLSALISPDEKPADGSAEPVTRNTVADDKDAACRSIQAYSAEGEHKAAVDASAQLAGKGQTCPEEVQISVEISRSLVNRDA